EGPDGGAVAEGEVERFGRTADVIEDELDLGMRNHLPKLLLDAAEHGLRALEPQARGSADVQPELAGVDLREDDATDARGDRDGRGYCQTGDHECRLARVEEALEYRGVARADCDVTIVEALIHAAEPASRVRSGGETGLGTHLVLLVSQKKRRHHGHEG